ncbi:hypothetical protein [Burkholderia ambifaria]|uniref:hypothetical protein n=1 Tax=Burkholderia ambifaria TaxID=152480 RepID=UPI00158B09D8|nr:hypothetical protein [Burkholderia ambifaria]
MTELILSRDQILKIVRKTLKENDDRDKLSTQRFVDLATAIEAAVLEKVCGEVVAEVVSWANGSYHRKYQLEWKRDVGVGTKLYALTRSKP